MPSQKPEPHPQSEPEPKPQTRTRRCRHIHTAGHQCGSPCLRTEQFCYFHHTTRRPVSDPKTRRARKTTYELPVPEDRDSIRAAIAQVMHDIANNHIDNRRAGLILYSLQIALCALPKDSLMPAQTVSISAAARPASRRSSGRKSNPIKQIPSEPIVEETVFDQTFGLIASETFLHPEVEEEEESDELEDPGDDIQESGRRLRDCFGYKLLKDVEIYEAHHRGYEEARHDLATDGKLHPAPPTKAIDIDAAAEQPQSQPQPGAPYLDPEMWAFAPRANRFRPRMTQTTQTSTNYFTAPAIASSNWIPFLSSKSPSA